MNVTKEMVLATAASPPNFTDGSIFFIGTATVIVRYAGFTILTDPNFLHKGDHVHVGYGITSERLTNPAIAIEDLPEVDLLVLSHLHDDHFDRVAAEKLAKALPIVTTGHAARGLQKMGFTATQDLKTWETIAVKKGDASLQISAMPGIHGPGLLRYALPPVMGSMLEFQTKTGETRFRLYITGDTLIHNHLKEIPKRYPDVDLALLHLGGTKAFGVMLTMDGKQGVEAIQIIEPRTAIPIHFNDYTIFKSPLEDFKQAVNAAGLHDRVKYLNHGDTYNFKVKP